MDVKDIKEYNKIVIDVAREVSKPWKWATFIMAFLLAGMLMLYLFNPSTVDIEQENNHSPNAQNIKG